MGHWGSFRTSKLCQLICPVLACFRVSGIELPRSSGFSLLAPQIRMMVETRGCLGEGRLLTREFWKSSY